LIVKHPEQYKNLRKEFERVMDRMLTLRFHENFTLILDLKEKLDQIQGGSDRSAGR